MEETVAEYFVVLCWDRVVAGPQPGGPPWLFVMPEHAEGYAAQLRGQGIPAQVRGRWQAKMTAWNGVSLIHHPAIPAPQLSQSMLSSPPLPQASADHDASANGVAQPNATLAPPPTPSLE